MRAETMDRAKVRGLVAAEVRAEMARQQISGASLPQLIGGTRSYWQRRLSGEFPMDVEDLAALSDLLEVPVGAFWGSVSASGHVTRG